jgi:hypothetical protein
MGTRKTRQYCPEEKRMVLAERPAPNHVLHLLLTVVSGGIWLPIWLLITVFGGGRYKCPSCGAYTRGWTSKEEKRLLRQQ